MTTPTRTEPLPDAARTMPRSVPRSVPPSPAPAPNGRVYAAMAVVLVAWASAFVGIRAVAAHLDPGPLSLGRLLAALPALALIGWWPTATRRMPAAQRLPRLPRGRDAALVVLYGTLWFGAYGVALGAAERHLDAGTAAMLVNVAPSLVAVFAGLLLGEGFPRRLVLGLAVSTAGVALIGLGGRGHHATGLGIAVALLAAVLYAVGVLIQKVVLRRVDAASVTFLGVAAAVGALAPFLPSLLDQLAHAPRSTALWLVYLGLVPTALAFSLWAYVLRRSPAGRTTSATLAVPAIVVLLSWAMLGEVPTTFAVAGGALALLGVALGRRP